MEEAGKVEGKKGKSFGFMSGKALFTYDPTMFEDDEDAADDDTLKELEKQQRKEDLEAAKKLVGAEETKVDAGLFNAEGADIDDDIDFD